MMLGLLPLLELCSNVSMASLARPVLSILLSFLTAASYDVTPLCYYVTAKEEREQEEALTACI